MTMTSRLQELRRKHADLSDQVEVAQRSPGVPDAEIVEMKKQKLRLKEEMSRIGSA
ncbi:MAG: YdcH family protein [Maritimibacter sp.]